MKHAMLMTINNNIEILKLFIELFDDKRYDFYILIDKKADISKEDMFKLSSKNSKIIFLPKRNIFWGGYSQIDAYLELLEESSKNNYDYYHFFQGSDFPLRTKDEVDVFFEKNKGKEFINIYKNDFAKYKCCYYHLFVETPSYRSNIFIKAANHFFVKIQKIINIKRNNDMELYHGSALNSLTHDCVKYVCGIRSKIKERFCFSLGADEVFLQTIIAASPFAEKIYRFENSIEANCRLIDWQRREGNSPYTYTYEDFEDLLNFGEGICFCRKVTEEKSIELVKKLYSYLKGKEKI